MSTTQIIIGIYLLSALLLHIHLDISFYNKRGRNRYRTFPIYVITKIKGELYPYKFDKKTLIVSFYFPFFNTYRAIAMWLLAFPIKKNVKKGCLCDKTDEMVDSYFESLVSFYHKDTTFFEEQFKDLLTHEQNRFIYWTMEQGALKERVLELLKLMDELTEELTEKEEINEENNKQNEQHKDGTENI